MKQECWVQQLQPITEEQLAKAKETARRKNKKYNPSWGNLTPPKPLKGYHYMIEDDEATIEHQIDAVTKASRRYGCGRYRFFIRQLEPYRKGPIITKFVVDDFGVKFIPNRKEL